MGRAVSPTLFLLRGGLGAIYIWIDGYQPPDAGYRLNNGHFFFTGEFMRKLTRWGRVAAVAAAVLFGAVAVATAQGEKPKIALYISGDNLKPADKNILTRKFLSPFTASGMYSVIDRSDVFSQKVDQERKKQRDGSVSDSMIYVIGHEAGAKYVCMVELDYGLGRWNIGARMVDVVTAEIYLNSGDADIKGKLEDADFDGAAKTVFDKIHGKRSGSAAQTAQYQAPAPVPAPTPAVAVQQPVYQAPPTPPTHINYGSLRDTRDGKTYRTTVIGGKTWMAENLNYEYGESKCKGNDNSNCDKYGRTYDWNMAKKICPAGFHLPTDKEWKNLLETVGGDKLAGKKLKARSGWKDLKDGSSGNGTDDFGFSILSGGDDLWTATGDGSNNAMNVFISGSDGSVWMMTSNRNSTSYVRCVKN